MPARLGGWNDGVAHLIKKHLRPHMRLLDLGAGAGKAGPVNFRHEVAEVVGVDPYRATAGNSSVDRWVLGMAESLPFQTESFDLVFTDGAWSTWPTPLLWHRRSSGC